MHISSKNDFDETKCMSFLIKDIELLEKCDEIFKKVGNSIRKEFDSEPVYNEKYLKTKMKILSGKNQHKF